MKKIQTLLMMFSLFFLFSFSYADITFTFEDGKYATYGNTYTNDYDGYLSDVNSISSLDPNQVTVALPDLVVPDSVVAEYPYQTIFRGVLPYYVVIFSKQPLMAKTSDVADYDYAINRYKSLLFESGKDSFMQYTTYPGKSSWSGQRISSATNAVYTTDESSCAIYYANYELLNYNTKTQVYFDNSVSVPKMENPLTDEEIKTILQVFLESVRDADLPEHYGRYVLTYNKITGRYSGFVYPNYIDLGIRYGDFDEDDNFYIVENSTGLYYVFSSYQEDEDYISRFFDAIDLSMKHPLLYEFRSNSTNTSFRFNTTYDLEYYLENGFVISTLDEPIIYTSHKIYSLLLTGSDVLGFAKYEVDEETSIENKVFTDEETGLPTDTTLNEYTEEPNTDVNLVSFIKLLFQFVLAIASFLVRFLSFIVTFIMVPSSTSILPPEFITGIDWIHSFAFGEILLWDIFSILFAVLLSMYLVKLIRSH